MANEQCSNWQPSLVLFAAGGELDVVQESELAAHLTACSHCSSALESERELLAILGEHRVEPDANLLANCRAGLEDALDRQEEGGWLRRKVVALLPADWFSPSPAWSAALLVMIGFSVGLFGPRYLPLQHLAARHSPAKVAYGSAGSSSASAASQDKGRDEEEVVVPSSPVSSRTFDLHKAEVAGINVVPAGDGNDLPQVQLQLRTQEPVTVQGTVDDDNVKRVLLYILRNNQRFDPGVRLDAVDLLRQRSADPAVLAALCQALKTDADASVRLKALDALDGGEGQKEVQQDAISKALARCVKAGVESGRTR